MDRDGTGAGFDCELTAAAAGSLSIPVIASGGAGNAQHFAEVFTVGKADAALAASVFHFATQHFATQHFGAQHVSTSHFGAQHFGANAVAELKQALLDQGIPMRWPC